MNKQYLHPRLHNLQKKLTAEQLQVLYLDIRQSIKMYPFSSEQLNDLFFSYENSEININSRKIHNYAREGKT